MESAGRGWAHLAEAHIMAQVCSAALMVLPPGVLENEMNSLLCYSENRQVPHFMTMMPCAVAAPRSMLSTPVPARPISFSLLPAWITSEVTLVAERTIKPSYSWREVGGASQDMHENKNLSWILFKGMYAEFSPK